MKQTTNGGLSTTLDFCVRLLKANAALSRRFDGRLGTWHGLSFGDFVVLLHLSAAPDGRLRRVDLAAALGVTPSAVTRTLIPLEKIGLVSRRPDPHDARIGYAALTAAGRRTLTEAVDSAEMLSEDFLDGTSGRDVAQLEKLLAGI